MKTGIELIAQERAEQIEKHGRSIELDQVYDEGELVKAAKALLHDRFDMRIELLAGIGWDYAICRHMADKPYKERLIIAGALIAAEIDRLQAIESDKPTKP